jgi:hypothetical protein
VTTLSEGEAPDAPLASSRHQMRLDRQARVGILRNLKEPPRLPPRRTSLTGKWLDLRSRRRLQRDRIEPLASPEAEPGQEAVAGPVPGDGDRPARGASLQPATHADPLAARLRRSLRDLAAEAKTAPAGAQEGALAPDPDQEGPRGNIRGPTAHRGLRFAAGVLVGAAIAFVCTLAALWMFAPG